jgi:hypothetical protein
VPFKRRAVPDDISTVPDILPGGDNPQRGFFDISPRSSSERRWRWVGIVMVLVGLVAMRMGQAPSPQASGRLWLALPGLVFILAGGVTTLLSFRRR